MEYAIIAAVILIIIIGFILYRFFKKRKKAGKDSASAAETVKQKKPKVKKNRFKLKKEDKNKNVTEIKGSYVDTVDKFLFRKELKVLVLISRVLPKGYVAFPKIGVDTILEPVGRKDLFDMVANKYIDIVVFDELTMKPKVAIDIFDGSIGDEQVNISCPHVVKALEMAELPLVYIKVKTDYTEEEIKNPIYQALGLATDDEDEKKNVKNYEEF